ncbi:MAG: hypothetical protein H3C68_06430 [Deltaproteobacteria bacterium]|nr:hypothetical protein [Deltaproteobacteria bacterium]MBZ0219608.1 hypothetical protein [Deltaproteobacteria bacterium]
MIIAGSDIQMGAARSQAEHRETKNELKVWLGPRPPEGGRGEARPLPARDVLNISDEARTRFDAIKKKSKALYRGLERKIDISGGVDHETFIRKLLIEALTGAKIKIKDLVPKAPENTEAEDPQTGQAGRGGEWGMSYESSTVSASFEAVTFSASGTIKTAEGDEIGFSLELVMARASITMTDTSIRAGNAVDPLVINYGGKAADLTSMRFSFDLDADGNQELIPFAGPGSGFLALDKNDDGIVNDGSELFGPMTGHGFKELSKYDFDGNNWIDEADPVFKDLRVWTKDAPGNDTFLSLSELGIGAVYLGYAEGDFDVRDQGNNALGQVRRTGLFLAENLTPGTVQQIDLIV